MKKKKRIAQIFVLIFTILIFSSNKPLSADHFVASFDLSLGVPLNAFEKAMEHPVFGPGIVGKFGFKLGKTLLYLGIGGHFFQYGQGGREAIVFIPEFGDVGLDITNTYQMYGAFLFLRYSPFENAKWRPFVEANVNWTELGSWTSIPGDCYDDDCYDLVTTKNLDDSAVGFGLGTGIIFRVGGRKNVRTGGWKETHGIHLSVHYQHLPTVDYMTRGSIEVEGDDVTYYIYTSEIQFLRISLGYTAHF